MEIVRTVESSLPACPVCLDHRLVLEVCSVQATRLAALPRKASSPQELVFCQLLDRAADRDR